ncbi:hypothetical protein EJ05DRAFT_537583 [Pseudovirgaria hyperparasitica]|uniref:Uncharacterized protein n=1 Tax=Pseudovirgaria hyperparasitica TaxID=470096 RepID=A0A6A6W9D9_9PEZI|nr:uncharacterized protein EJ05DRAFT_537583 [Pseudovirgaria hyperparasitica]KAF2759283.1 hypothetical protein EJ05DRAFT_537583 [Pseudovirgaria hyperparasitica]
MVIMNDFHWNGNIMYINGLPTTQYAATGPSYDSKARGITPSSVSQLGSFSPRSQGSNVSPVLEEYDVASSPTGSLYSSHSVMTPPNDSLDQDLYGIRDSTPQEMPIDDRMLDLERRHSQQSMSSNQSSLWHRESQGSAHSPSPTYAIQQPMTNEYPVRHEHDSTFQVTGWSMSAPQQLTASTRPSMAMTPLAFPPPRWADLSPWSPHQMPTTPAPSSAPIWELGSDPKGYAPTNAGVDWCINNYDNTTMYNTQSSQYANTHDGVPFDSRSPVSGPEPAYRPNDIAPIGRSLYPHSYHLEIPSQSTYQSSTIPAHIDYYQLTHGSQGILHNGPSLFSNPGPTWEGASSTTKDNHITDQHLYSANGATSSSQMDTTRSKKSYAKNTRGVRKPYGPSAQRAGGRKPGTHLAPDKAAQANVMRKTRVCWRCRIQRDKCDPGEICRRCANRSQKPGDDWKLGCCRDILPELMIFLLPTWISDLHSEETLIKMCETNVRDWGKSEIKIQLTPGYGLPWLEVDVYEFKPSNPELLRQFQHFKDAKTGQNIRVEKASPPLGLQSMHYTKDETKYDTHVKQIATHFMTNFVGRYYAGEKEDFAKRMFECLVNIDPAQGTEQEKLLTEVYYLIITTYIVAHTLTIPDEHKVDSLSKLSNYKPDDYGDKTSPRLANRQIKHFYARLQGRKMEMLLKHLQNMLGGSKGCDKWTDAFIIVLGLAIAAEVIQKNVNSILDSRVGQGDLERSFAEEGANEAVRRIDGYFDIIIELFQKKYARNCNPIKDCKIDWSAKITQPGMITCLQNLSSLIQEKRNFLEERARVAVSMHNWRQYTGRITARFLLSFVKLED